ncbi:FAD-dependent monooxygenase [Pokkaliibacter plantistimulans]|uniref:FAD-dependent monooxygenase n=1 Tax=Pokkaliibacter plantistimulans TaxID=1635171 RepID=UPI000D74CCDB|nr:FAD-dependent monooxygenase [Pokkaliibacter plantistimulans]
MSYTPVLIVGGSLVGLSASLFLAARGVPHVLVEKHPGSSPHPRAMGFTETTMEHYRTVGIGHLIPQVPAETRLRRVTVDSLTGQWQSEQVWTPGAGSLRAADLSPCSGAAIAQDRLEPILREAALTRGADLRLSTELLDFEQNGHEVVACLRNRNSGEEYRLAASYMIAADGADSPIRQALGIRREGVGHLRTLQSVLFHCPQADFWLSRGAQQFSIVQEGFRAFLTTYGDSRWVLMLDDDQPRSDEALQQAIRRALGQNMAFDILATGRWEMAGRIATCYQQGRVFLAGDAAHQLPPTRGGFGANTGIDDVWNLAWKLQHVLRGQASPALLESYDAERRPIGWLRHQQTFSRPDYLPWVGADFQPAPLLPDDALEFGQRLCSRAIAAADASLPAAATPQQWAGQPGTRAPHVWIKRGGETCSSLDLFGQDFVLLSGVAHWQTVAEELQLSFVHTEDEVQFPAEQLYTDMFGVARDGAVLVRPDGIVAWRTDCPVQQGGANELRAAFIQLAMPAGDREPLSQCASTASGLPGVSSEAAASARTAS